MSTRVPQSLIDTIACLEAETLLNGLNDPELRANPAFLAKVRQFLKDNNFVTTTETTGVKEIIRDISTIPDLVSEEVLH